MINTKLKYRIKTEREFEQEFGMNWREEVSLHWISPNMDYLFGKYILENIDDDKKIKGNSDIIYKDYYHISWDMIKYDPMFPNYSPKKFSREI